MLSRHGREIHEPASQNQAVESETKRWLYSLLSARDDRLVSSVEGCVQHHGGSASRMFCSHHHAGTMTGIQNYKGRCSLQTVQSWSNSLHGNYSMWIKLGHEYPKWKCLKVFYPKGIKLYQGSQLFQGKQTFSRLTQFGWIKTHILLNMVSFILFDNSCIKRIV